MKMIMILIIITKKIKVDLVDYQKQKKKKIKIFNFLDLKEQKQNILNKVYGTLDGEIIVIYCLNFQFYT